MHIIANAMHGRLLIGDAKFARPWTRATPGTGAAPWRGAHIPVPPRQALTPSAASP